MGNLCLICVYGFSMLESVSNVHLIYSVSIVEYILSTFLFCLNQSNLVETIVAGFGCATIALRLFAVVLSKLHHQISIKHYRFPEEKETHYDSNTQYIYAGGLVFHLL